MEYDEDRSILCGNASGFELLRNSIDQLLHQEMDRISISQQEIVFDALALQTRIHEEAPKPDNPVSCFLNNILGVGLVLSIPFFVIYGAYHFIRSLF